jgi:hypothetical protein
MRYSFTSANCGPASEASAGVLRNGRVERHFDFGMDRLLPESGYNPVLTVTITRYFERSSTSIREPVIEVLTSHRAEGKPSHEVVPVRASMLVGSRVRAFS